MKNRETHATEEGPKSKQVRQALCRECTHLSNPVYLPGFRCHSLARCDWLSYPITLGGEGSMEGSVLTEQREERAGSYFYGIIFSITHYCASTLLDFFSKWCVPTWNLTVEWTKNNQLVLCQFQLLGNFGYVWVSVLIRYFLLYSRTVWPLCENILFIWSKSADILHLELRRDKKKIVHYSVSLQLGPQR